MPRILTTLEDLGDQLSFYGRAIAWIPRTVRRYRKEIAGPARSSSSSGRRA